MLAALLLAGGASTRVGEDKALADLGGMPLVRWSAARLVADPRIDLLVVAARADAHGAMVEALLGLGRVEVRIVTGGETRAASARAAVRAAAQAERVLVHDAARPFLDAATLSRVLEALDGYGAAAAALPVADALRRGDEWAGETVERAGLWAMQTPQAFARQTLEDAYARASDEPPDCAAAVLATGAGVRLVRGHPLNFKVTSADDLAFARALVAAEVVRPALPVPVR